MKKLLNTLFVTTENAYLSLDGENVVIFIEQEERTRFPLHTLEQIISFSYSGASPALMGGCAKRGIGLCFCRPNGRFLARAVGELNGNVLLRRTQYRWADDAGQSLSIAKNMISGKVYNARWSIERTKRDHALRVDADKLSATSEYLQKGLSRVKRAESMEELRGVEGECAAAYFRVFDDRILHEKDAFFFHARSRRPPLDRVNALLSFAYALLSNDCAGALESVGLDSYVGFLHRDRPGRASLALDLMEELRAPVADRFVLTQINTRAIKSADFLERESGAVGLTDEGRKKFMELGRSENERKSRILTSRKR